MFEEVRGYLVVGHVIGTWYVAQVTALSGLASLAIFLDWG